MKRSIIYTQSIVSTSNYKLEFLSFYQFPLFLQNKTVKINLNVNPDFFNVSGERESWLEET